MSKLFVQPLHHNNLDEIVEFAASSGFNLEIASFAYANAFEMDWQKALQEHKRALSGFKGEISFHGVFQDVLVHSSDAKIAQVSKERVFESLKIASVLGAKQVIFHGNFNPFVTDPFYQKFWVERNTSFWMDALKMYNGLILIENLWESTPEPFCSLLNNVGSSRLKVCLDVAHANVYSKNSLREWIAALEKHIKCVHISDNNGLSDQHLEIGQGKIDWANFTRLLYEHRLSPEIVLELCELGSMKNSIDYMKKNRLYPFISKDHWSNCT